MPKSERPLEIPHVELPCCEWAESRGWFQTKVWSASANGFPDRFMAKGGCVVLVEFKRPGEEPGAQQRRRHRMLLKAGVRVFAIDNVEGFKRMLQFHYDDFKASQRS